MTARGRRAPVATLAGMVCAAGLAAQPLHIVSEFQRVTPAGGVYAPDRVEKPREIISPAVARNAWASFRVLVEAPKGATYTIHVGQNPENAFRVKFYREKYARVGDARVPDELEETPLPHSATLSEDQSVQSYWLDAWVPRETPAGRFRLEVQMNLDGTWYIAPMEVRVRNVVLAGAIPPAGPLPAPGERSDSPAVQALRQYACGGDAPAAAEMPLAARRMIRRNAQQDIALGRQRERDETRAAVQATMARAAGFSSTEAFCQSSGLPTRGAEWWLKLRDYVVQGLPVP